MDLTSSTALVTGANRGFGRALAAELLRRGATVYAGARNSDQIDLPGATPIAVDITDPASVAAAALPAGDVTILINNAASPPGADLLTGDLADIRLEMDAHYLGTPLGRPRLQKPRSKLQLHNDPIEEYARTAFRGISLTAEPSRKALRRGGRKSLPVRDFGPHFGPCGNCRWSSVDTQSGNQSFPFTPARAPPSQGTPIFMTTPSPQPTNNRRTSPLMAVCVVAVLAVIGIYAANDDDAPASSSSTATYTPPTAQAEPTAATGTPGAAAPVEVVTVVVPDVVGMNHQAAQDTLQAAGFYLLREEDATGQGRMLILDRNWEVVSQSAAAGTTMPIDTWITLSSKKIGE